MLRIRFEDDWSDESNLGQLLRVITVLRRLSASESWYFLRTLTIDLPWLNTRPSADDWQCVTRELNLTLDAPDGFDVAVRKLRPKEDWASEMVNHVEENSVEGITKPYPKEDLMLHN